MKVLVTGHTGFVGRNMMEYFAQYFPDNWELVAATDCGKKYGTKFDLQDECDVRNMFHKHRPDVVVHLAAKVGGIGANMETPVQFFTHNMQMGMNVLEGCAAYNAYCILVGTVCSYPRDCPVPFQESNLWNGEPELTNSAYGEAKRGLYKLLWAYNKQFGMKGTVLLPTNMYGKYDNFDPKTSHVIPALIRKFEDQTTVEVWGTGRATREFLHVDDFCHAVLLTILQQPDYPLPMNVAGGDEVSITELVHMIAKATDFDGKIVFNSSKPDGQPRRKVDGTLAMKTIGYRPARRLEEEIPKVVQWYRSLK